jgi:hypothetical protein
MPRSVCRMRSLRSALGLIGLLLGEAVVIVGLHQLGSVRWLTIPYGDWSAWLTTSAVEDVVVALARLVALACAYWLLATTMLYAVAVATRIPGAVRTIRWATLPAVRRLAERTTALVLASSTVASGGASALAAESVTAEVGAADPAVVQLVGGPVPSPPQATQPRSAVLVPPGAAGSPAAVDGGVGPVVGGGPADVHVVVGGDSLWTIARARVAAASEHAAPTPAQVHRYWADLVRGNAGTLPSGDPDRIHPGDRVVLPPVEGAAR